MIGFEAIDDTVWLDYPLAPGLRMTVFRFMGEKSRFILPSELMRYVDAVRRLEAEECGMNGLSMT